MSLARMTIRPNIKRRIPSIHGITERISTVITIFLIFKKDISQNTLDSLGIGRILLQTLGICIQPKGDPSIPHGLDIVIQRLTAFFLTRLGTAFGPSLASAFHESVFFVGPDAHTFVFEELFHPVVVGAVFKESCVLFLCNREIL
jgi:hypothetical protein